LQKQFWGDISRFSV